MSYEITTHIICNKHWLLRFALLFLLIIMLSPLIHPPPAQIQYTLETTKEQVCVHTDLINEVEEVKIERSLKLVREMGASTIVEFFPWSYIESQEGHYSWWQADRIVHHANLQDIRIIARMGLVPNWARPGEPTANYLPEESFDEFADFVAAFAARYAGTIDQIIILNEPNLAFEWGYQEIDPSRYVRLLQAVYGPVHAANPNVVILAPALAPTLEPDGSPHGLNDLTYLEEMYHAGAADYFDALAIHTYGLTNPPQTAPDPQEFSFRRAELVYELMLRYDDPNKPVYITESGWNDNPRWAYAVRPSQRIAYTLDALQWAEENWPWAKTLCIWIFRHPTLRQNHRDNYTLVTPDSQLKPIYYSIQSYARGWEREEELWLPPPGN